MCNIVVVLRNTYIEIYFQEINDVGCAMMYTGKSTKKPMRKLQVFRTSGFSSENRCASMVVT
jgi:hypothetical protein